MTNSVWTPREEETKDLSRTMTMTNPLPWIAISLFLCWDEMPITHPKSLAILTGYDGRPMGPQVQAKSPTSSFNRAENLMKLSLIS